MRLCTKCDVLKPEVDFYLDKSRKKKPNSCCKACHYKATRHYYLNNKDKVNLISKKSRWKAEGMDVEQALYVLDTQRYCGICASTADLVLDHCHETKKVRGMLCQKCNKGLGSFNDDRDLVLSAADYLNRH